MGSTMWFKDQSKAGKLAIAQSLRIRGAQQANSSFCLPKPLLTPTHHASLFLPLHMPMFIEIFAQSHASPSYSANGPQSSGGNLLLRLTLGHILPLPTSGRQVESKAHSARVLSSATTWVLSAWHLQILHVITCVPSGRSSFLPPHKVVWFGRLIGHCGVLVSGSIWGELMRMEEELKIMVLMQCKWMVRGQHGISGI